MTHICTKAETPVHITPGVDHKLTGGTRFSDGNVILTLPRANLTAWAFPDRPLSCERTDKGYGKRASFTVTAPVGKAKSLHVNGKGGLNLHLTTEEAIDLEATLAELLQN
jgi:hypothetical protein